MSSGFVSETELAERRRIRQEEWEKVRTAEQPLGIIKIQRIKYIYCFYFFFKYVHPILEVPDEQYDHRSLFDRLEEQRRKKEYEYEETHKLSK